MPGEDVRNYQRCFGLNRCPNLEQVQATYCQQISLNDAQNVANLKDAHSASETRLLKQWVQSQQLHKQPNPLHQQNVAYNRSPDLPEEIESEGLIYHRQRDPPGQKSIYILPGDETKETYRLSTYLKFNEIPVDPVKLAKHGFLYTGYKDRVKCFSCGANVQNWYVTDDPASAQWHYSGCELVLGKDKRNKPIINRAITFVGTFETANPSSTDQGSSCNQPSSSSLNQTRPLFQLSNPIACDEVNSVPSTAAVEEVLSDNLNNIQIGSSSVTASNYSQNAKSQVKSMQKTTSQTSQIQLKYPVEGLVIGNIISVVHIDMIQSLNLHKEVDRRKSFSMWAFNFQLVTPSVLAINGFFYLVAENADAEYILNQIDPTPIHTEMLSFLYGPGFATFGRYLVCRRSNDEMTQAADLAFACDNDRVQCFSCSIVICNWLPNDDVAAVHRNKSPNCSMVLGLERRNIPMTNTASLPCVTEPPDPTPEESLHLAQMFPCYHPHSQHMTDVQDRMRTFDLRWPRNRIYAAVELIAKAGFFFLGERDRAKCFYCNGGLQNWNALDEPFTEHAKWFPGCEFILRMKGVEFVKQVCIDNPNVNRPHLPLSRFNPTTLQVISIREVSNPQASRNIVNNCAGAVLTNGSNPEQSQSSLSPNFGVNESIAGVVRAMGFTDEQIQRVSQRRMRVRGRNFDNFQELLNELLDDDGPTPRDVTPPPQAATSSTQPPGSSETSLKRHKTKSSGEGSNGDTSGETPIKRTKSGLFNNERDVLANLEYERSCKLCHKNVADGVIMPCGHLALCDSCSETAKRCPICKHKVENVIKAFLS